MQTQKVKIQFVKEFKELFNEDWRTIVFYGGRNSGKSYHTALALLLRARQKKLRILCTREVQNTIKDSVHKLLSDIITNYEFSDYDITKDSIRNTLTGSEFIFKGLRMNVNEIKSTEGIDICWIEEGQAITDNSLDILMPTIRKENSQVIITFNRFNELDPVYVRYVMNKDEKTFVLKVNYDALERCGLVSEAIYTEMDRDKANPDLYAYKWLGEPLGQAEMSIISRSQILNAMSREVNDDGQEIIGVDVARMGNDRTVFWKRKGLKTITSVSYDKNTIPQAADYLEKFANFNKETEIRIDDTGVGGGLTDIMKNNGYNIIPINFGGEPVDKDKYTNLISEAWFHLSNIVNDIQLPMDQDLLMELSTRQWKQDNKGRRAIESKNEYKKRGFRSPDLADACIICYYNPQIQIVEEDDIEFM